MQTLKNAVLLILAWLKSGEFLDLLSARQHSPYLARHRLTAIATRVRLVAISFSVLTLLWIGLDILTLPGDHWAVLAACRLAAAAIFFVLALMPEKEQSRGRSLAMLATLLAVPLVIYAVSQHLLLGHDLQGLAAINGSIYQALPLVVLAGLCIFPLVVYESLVFAAAITAAVAGVQTLLIGVNVIDLIAMLWGLLLALGVYLLACAIQLHYMMALLHRSNHDPLTGALTRRSGVEILDIYFRLACDQDAPLSVLFIDADHFKAINDNFGHDAGDQALKSLAGRLQQQLRKADMIIRWGGEEFVVVLTNTPMQGAGIVVRRLMRDWFGQRPDGQPLTASMGLAERQTDAISDWPQLVALADERMYAAKTSGRACCFNHAGRLQANGVDDPAPLAVAAG
jgi:diguanylate cyclase (GGDEF)-like protein